mgnify:FL=1
MFCSCKKNLRVVIYIYNATKTYDCAKKLIVYKSIIKGAEVMKIIKRNGAEETFDRQKIKDAIAKANNETDGTPELTDRQIDYISLVI